MSFWRRQLRLWSSWPASRSCLTNILYDFKTVSKVIDEITLTQSDNFARWPVLDQYLGAGLIALGSWDAEVDYVNTFFQQRIVWMDDYIMNL